MIKIFEAHYPETLRKVFVINGTNLLHILNPLKN